MHSKLSVILLVLVAAVSFAGADDQAEQNIIEGSLTHTAWPNGQWKAWFDAAGAETTCASVDALWFCKGGNVWRYNVRTQQVDAYTSPLTQPGQGRGGWSRALAADGRFAFATQAGIALWDADRWRRLPWPNGESFTTGVAFDAQGTLWATSQHGYAWDGQCWTQKMPLPGTRTFWALNDQWLTYDAQPGTGLIYTIWNATMAESQPAPAEIKDHHFFPGNIYRSARHTYAVFQAPQGQPGGTRVVFEFVDGNFVKKVEGRYVGLDLARDEFFYVEMPVVGGPGRQFTLKSPDGQTLAVLPWPEGLSFRSDLIRDAHGHYWVGPFRHDGQRWQAMLPPSAFLVSGSIREEIRQGRLVLDEAKQTWVDAWPDIPSGTMAYDPAARTGWLVHSAGRDVPRVMQKYHFSADGKSELLTSFPLDTPTYVRIPPAPVEVDGQPWFQGFYRWDGKVFHQYDDGSKGSTLPSSHQPGLVKDARGGLWMLTAMGTWMKYDAQADQFREAIPFDEFRFSVGEETFSIVGSLPGEPVFGRSELGVIYRKDATGWGPLVLSFLPRQTADEADTPLLGCSGRLARDNRMLVSCSEGVFELDLAAGRQAFLSPEANLLAYYDAKGRRVLIAPDQAGQIFLFDGETMLATSADSTPQEELTAAVKDLLSRMDDNEWDQRDKATREAINLLRRHPEEVVTILRRSDLARGNSPEVQARVEYALSVAAPDRMNPGRVASEVLARRALGNSLLERMHPYPPTDVSYVVQPGMQQQHARAVFLAAGAKITSEVHRGPDAARSYYGYVLPDGTMIYVCLDDHTATGKIVSLGLGEVGKGYDPKWDWTDRTKNGLNSLKLKPHLGRGANRS